MRVLSGKITALKVQARNQQRVSVYLDGQFAFGLAAIEAVRLKVGQQLSEADVARLSAADEVEIAHERALRLLAHRPRSAAELRRSLFRHKVPEAAVEAVIERLQNAGLVDDAAFARFWTENRAAFRPKARRALESELRGKGLAREAVDAALAGHDEDAAALAAARKRAPRLARLSEQDFRRKLGEFLARRGFDYETISAVVVRVWNEARPAGSYESED